MAIRDLIRRETPNFLRRGYDNPFTALQREMNRMFEDFTGGRELQPFGWGEFAPRVEVNDTPEHVEVTAELPGMSENDLELSISPNGDMLTLKGEKRHEREERREGAYFSERAYGTFHRNVMLPAPVHEDQAEARMHNGVLHVKMQKRRPGEGGPKKIPVAG